jgi:hypothetical protein
MNSWVKLSSQFLNLIFSVSNTGYKSGSTDMYQVDFLLHAFTYDVLSTNHLCPLIPWVDIFNQDSINTEGWRPGFFFLAAKYGGINSGWCIYGGNHPHLLRNVFWRQKKNPAGDINVWTEEQAIIGAVTFKKWKGKVKTPKGYLQICRILEPRWYLRSVSIIKPIIHGAASCASTKAYVRSSSTSSSLIFKAFFARNSKVVFHWSWIHHAKRQD